MSGLWAKIKSFGRFLRQNIGIVAISLAMAYMLATVFGIKEKTEAQLLQSDKAATYEVKPGDGLFALKGEALNNVSHFIVAGDAAFEGKSVVIKLKDSREVSIYRDVGYEGFKAYQESTLTPFLAAHPDVDFRFMSGLDGVGERIGVINDPTELIASNRLGDLTRSVLGTLGTILLFVFIFALLMFMQTGALTNTIDKIDPKNLDDSLDDLVGLKDVKDELLQLQEMIENRKLYREYAVDKPFNVMLTGPAGVGKTKIARCLAKRLNIPMFYASAASLQSGYVGGGPRTLKKLAKMASKQKRAIIFLDEAESILQSRAGNGLQNYEKDTINTLLSLLDGVKSKDREVIWLVASNMDEHKMNMDEAMLRRFPLKVNFRLPNFDERKEILSRLVTKLDASKLADDIDLSHVAGVTTGMSPALLETLVSRASLMAVQAKAKVTQERLLNAFERVAVGLTDRATTAKMDEKRRVVAIHEAGHFLMQVHSALVKKKGDLATLGEALPVIKISTESVSKIGALGFVLSKSEDAPLMTRNEYEAQVLHLYGGMANEELYHGMDGVTAGAHNDIEKVTEILTLMIRDVGFYQSAKLNYGILAKSGLESDSLRPSIEGLSSRLYREAVGVLSSFRPLTDTMVNALMNDYVLTIDQAIPLVEAFFSERPELLIAYTGQSDAIEAEPELLKTA
ncbi:AAA family ATPase [Pseudomonas amygdali]|uniref:AAA ATPase n=2 Tax=Pseudomonas amygdali pv. lachrymans TaxID=53707 RepID=A0ABR5KRZ0_PSEAV|nr:AAA family ATPase [Pseudomonas amygdali]AXH60151.1 AAA family ATPase [Pseudomonas amygdali pv. lachrymans str. M301315]KPC17554.1 AAA ATPase [Pseudomonas amygdali pv. lachrymans]RMT06283.1 AAA ATPase [Pseudomonas amygdali pv. lachrymans]